MRTPLDVEHGLLTVLFCLVAAHALWQGLRPGGAGRSERADHFLHAAMGGAMAVMPWGPGRTLSGRTAVLLFTAAAVWFLLPRPARRTAHATAALTARLPAAAGMAAMAWMLRPSHGHQHAATGHFGHVTAHPVQDTVVTTVLTSYLLGYAIWSLTRTMTPPLPAATTATAAARAHAAATTDPYGPTRHGAMALGTALMLLMPH
ncbi:DUF5134 domain-containing protein [Streptomyces sp. NPDC094032]|uniref:DUF5134 domain-containing protein n=1 Tax=Streptomyces sp. NPDC094032 TaxID=3155308 RepID=UPI00331D66D8